MNQMVIIAVLCLISVIGSPYVLYEDEQHAEIPLSRIRRQIYIDVSQAPPGTRLTIGHTGTLFKNNKHHLDGSAFASKKFKPSGPLNIGGQLDYRHKPSGIGVNVKAANTRGLGTDVRAQGQYKIIDNKKKALSVTGGYSKNFGGPIGTGRPNYNAGVKYRF